MAELKLLPCPFCGRGANVVTLCTGVAMKITGWMVGCDHPKCPVQPTQDFEFEWNPDNRAAATAKTLAIAAWNTRALSPELIERVMKFVGEEQLRALPTVAVQP